MSNLTAEQRRRLQKAKPAGTGGLSRGEFWASQEGLDLRAVQWGQHSAYDIFRKVLETEAKSYGAKKLMYLTMEDARVDSGNPPSPEDHCSIYDRKQYNFGQFKPVVPQHHGCFLEDTMIHSERGLVPIVDLVVGDHVLTHKGRYQPVVKTYRSGYRGDIYELNGEGWMTERHPVLSGDKWVSAKHLHTGDEISIREPSNRPIMTGKIGLLFDVLCSLLLRVMPLSTINFNSESDIWDGKVNAEDMEGVLRDHVEPVPYKNFMETLLKIGLSGSNLTGDSRFNLSLNGGPSGYHMSSPDLMSSFLRRHPAPLHNLSLTSSPDGDTVVSQSFSDRPPVNKVLLGELVFADPGEIRINDIFYGKVNSCQIPSPTQLTNIHKESYKGMVYNLDVKDDGSYLIGEQGLAVHNCRCWYEAIWDTPPVGLV